MSKYRIYELAKEYNTTSKVIIDILARHNVTAKNHMSSVGDDVKEIISNTFSRKESIKGEVNAEVKSGNIRTNMDIARQHPIKASEPIQSSKPEHQPRTQSNQQGQGSYQGQPRPNYQGAQRPNPQGQQRPNYQQGAQRPNPQGQQRPNYQQGAQRPNPQGQQRPNYQQGAQRPNPQGQQRPQFNQRPDQQSNQTTQHHAPSQKKEQVRTARPNTATHNSAGKPQHHGNQSRPQNSNNSRFNKNSTQNKSNNKARTSKPQHQPFQQPKAEQKPKLIQIAPSISVKDLAEKMKREVSEVIKKLMLLGIMVSINQEVDFDTASIVAEEFDIKVEELPPEEDPTEIPEIDDDASTLVLRPPVVTVMGHVDHGKTSLLDCIRKTHVTAQEAGGITQHIGAYQVNYQGKKVVFLDTPGHEAFTAMRARGAQVTDISILVVAADDGVMPQTIEAINHSKSAKVPIIVAVNKIDKPNANPDHVKQQLAEYNLIPEDWGGDTIMVEVSAHKKTGINDLLEMILLVAEMQELKANPNRFAQGTIIEAQLDKGRGPVATVLVQKGTLHIGDTIIAGTAYGKVRAMVNDRGEKVKKAPPSTPVEVLGLSDVPQAGDILNAIDEKTARVIAEKRVAKKRTEELEQSQKVSLDDLFKQIKEGNLKELNIVVKADVQGSIEAIKQALLNIKNEEVKVNVVHSGVGAINESDIMLASASNALIIGFNVRPDNNARKAAESEKVDIRTYRVIYDALNDVEAAIKGMLSPTFKEVVQGRTEVRQLFTISKVVIAGCYVLEGKITNSSQIRVIRDGIVIHEGKMESLRRFKDDVKEVASGYECGITLEKYRDLKEGDILEAFAMEEIKQSS